MRKILLFTALAASVICKAQKAENLVIITTDGYRWQELFNGMDREIADDKRFNQGDSAYLYKNYWAETPAERRMKLMPFFWTTVAAKGQVYGNRAYGNKVNVTNPYWFSYPGYSEIMCGFVDTAINKNEYKANPNTTLLEFLNRQPKLKGKVAAFGAWDAFDRILNEERSGIPVVCGFDAAGGKMPNANERMINVMQRDVHKEWKEETYDVFTHYAALEHLKTRKPRVLYISYGETDEWAHGRQYRSYLDAAHQFDAWLREIWTYLQSDPQYRNKTTLFLTVDHGRGDVPLDKWTSHGASVAGANQIWFAMMGAGIPAGGEMKSETQLYQKQFAQTMANLMGYTFVAEHPVAAAIK